MDTEEDIQKADEPSNSQQETEEHAVGNHLSTLPSTSTTSTNEKSEGIVYPDPNNPYKCISNGIPMSWNQTSQQWLPDVNVDEDFLAYYNASYGVQYDYASMPKPEPSKHAGEVTGDEENKSKEPPRKLTKEEKLLKKRETRKRKGEQEAERRKEGWFEMDEQKNTTVYASGFPPSIDEAAFAEFMAKCGVVQKDPRTGKPKVKLYRTEESEPKGDGTCCYIKMESVELALQILDGWQWDSAHKIHVERAKFELKGEFDPAKKKQRMSGTQKKKFMEKQQRIFEWKPDKPRNYRPRSDCTVVMRGMFTLEQIDRQAERIFTLKEDTQKLCEQRFGPVKKLVLYDTNPDGVITVTFESVEHADAAVQAMNGRIVGGQAIRATHWDGREQFKRAETEEERNRRENAWSQFLEDEEDGEHEGKNADGENGQIDDSSVAVSQKQNSDFGTSSSTVLTENDGPMAAVDLPVLASLEEYLTKERPLDRRVLSIQSHVVSGHVGNKSAVFPLQLHGYEVDDINSVQFSNHTQYSGGALGQRLAHAHLEQLFEGLRRNRLDRNYSHVLTGYCGDGTFLRHLASIVRECRQHRPDLRFVCDPVLGDNGKYYVPRELCEIYRSEVLPLADLITPNAFELGELSGISVSSESDCQLAIRALFSAHPNLQQIVCTSGLPPTAAQTMMACFAAEKISPQIDGGKCHFRLFRFHFPLIESTFVGSGDLFSALHLAWMDQTEGNLCAATRATLASMQAVLRRTAERAKAHSSFSSNECAARELQLVQSRWDLLRPRAEEINYVALEMPQ